MIIKERGLWVACAAAGLIILIISSLIMSHFPSDAASDVSGYGSPVIAFEFARVPADLWAVFGVDGDPERARRISMMDHGNRSDFLFMTIYTIFGALFGMAARRRHVMLGSLIFVAAMIAGLADAVETRTLLSITAQITEGIITPDGLTSLWMPVTLKFIMLAVSIVGAGLFMMSRDGVIWTVLGAITVLAALLSLPALLSTVNLGYLLTMSVGLGWSLMLAYALTRCFRAQKTPI
jgi:hypothetical protein